MICFDCKKKIVYNDWLECKQCKRRHHYSCQNITSADFREHGEQLRLTWKCLSCQNVTRRTRNDDTPVRSKIAQDTSETLHSEEVSKKINKSKSEDYRICFEDFSSLLDSKLCDIEQSITSKIKNDLHQAIEQLKLDFTRTTDFLAAELSDTKKKLDGTEKQLQSLHSENARLTGELLEVGGRLRNLENTSRSCNFEIHAAPELKQENLNNVVKNLCHTLKVPITEQDVRVVRRVARMVPSKDHPRNILTTVSSQHLRDNIINAFKRFNKENSANPINSSCLGIPGNFCKVYVVEHHAPEIKKLHAAARKFAKQKSYAYVWVKHGRVFLRKAENATPIIIKSIECLNNLD